MKKNTIILLHLLVAAVLWQCKSDPKMDKNEMLGHKWHATHMQANGERQPLEQGEDGSYLWFRKDGSFLKKEVEGTTTGNWQYDPNSRIVTISDSSETSTQTLVSLTNTELVLQSHSKDFGDVSLVFRNIKE